MANESLSWNDVMCTTGVVGGIVVSVEGWNASVSKIISLRSEEGMMTVRCSLSFGGKISPQHRRILAGYPTREQVIEFLSRTRWSKMSIGQLGTRNDPLRGENGVIEFSFTQRGGFCLIIPEDEETSAIIERLQRITGHRMLRAEA